MAYQEEAGALEHGGPVELALRRGPVLVPGSAKSLGWPDAPSRFCAKPPYLLSGQIKWIESSSTGPSHSCQSLSGPCLLLPVAAIYNYNRLLRSSIRRIRVVVQQHGRQSMIVAVSQLAGKGSSDSVGRI